MRNLTMLNRSARRIAPLQHWPDPAKHAHLAGRFVVRSKIDRAEMTVIATTGKDWDHVSVSRRNRTPNWPEMCQIKSLFFKPDETAMQLHVPEKDHINDHEYCLHLWRPTKVEIPRPPQDFV